MQNFSLVEAAEKSANFVQNHFGANTSNDIIIDVLKSFGTVFLHSENNELLQVQNKTNINNMVGIELDNEGEKYNVIRQQASQSEGQVVFNTTNILAQIDIGTEFIGNNNTYNATATTVGQALTLGNGTKSLVITKIETFATTKTAVVYCQNHGLAQGIQVVGSGFSVAGLTGTQTITAIDKNSLRFVNNSIVATTTLTSFTNTEYFTANIIKTNIRSVETGSITNIARGGSVIPSQTLQYINATGFIDYNEIGIGADLETDDNYRKRIIQPKKDPGRRPEIKTIVSNQSGVTRVQLVDCRPFVGNFTIYFLRDNDSDIIPTQQELDAIESILISDPKLAPTVTFDNVFVEAPTEIKRRFTLNGLLPNTDKMKEAVKAQLQETIYNLGIQGKSINGVIYEMTATNLQTLLIQNTQDSIGNLITNLNSVTITDVLSAPATLALGIGEFLTVDEVIFA